MAKNYKMMTRDSFLSKKKLVKEFVELGEFGMYIQEMTGDVIESIAKKANGETRPSNVESMALIIALSACDEDGNALFTEEDVPMIVKNNSIATLVALSDVAVRVSKLSSSAIDEAKRNLKNAPIGNSTSI